jgi:hypothetical protein
MDTIPENLEFGILYVSIRFRMTIHACCCGCGDKVVTPLSPSRWQLIYDGKTVSLEPSIGNWNSECQSHYWITNNKVITAERWTTERIESAKQWRRNSRERYYKNEPQLQKALDANSVNPSSGSMGMINRILSYIGIRRT